MFILLILLIISGGIFYQNVNSIVSANDNINNKLDLVINNAIEKNRIPGIAVSAVKDGEVIYSKGFEKSTGDNEIEIAPDTPLYIGSISKSFTSLAIMQLVEEEKINLDDPVGKYLSFFDVDKINFEGEITIRHLLHHRSGMTEEEYL